MRAGSSFDPLFYGDQDALEYLVRATVDGAEAIRTNAAAAITRHDGFHPNEAHACFCAFPRRTPVAGPRKITDLSDLIDAAYGDEVIRAPGADALNPITRSNGAHDQSPQHKKASGAQNSRLTAAPSASVHSSGHLRTVGLQSSHTQPGWIIGLQALPYLR